jgi:hypothetical protein
MEFLRQATPRLIQITARRIRSKPEDLTRGDPDRTLAFPRPLGNDFN